jgi:hypothetical protein
MRVTISDEGLENLVLPCWTLSSGHTQIGQCKNQTGGYVEAMGAGI